MGSSERTLGPGEGVRFAIGTDGRWVDFAGASMHCLLCARTGRPMLDGDRRDIPDTLKLKEDVEVYH